MLSFAGAAALLLQLWALQASAQRSAQVVTPNAPLPTTGYGAAQETYAPPQALAPASTNTGFIYTTPTTIWKAPTFATASPVPACSDTMCPSLNGQRCQDSTGVTYGVMCDQRFSGTVITSSGKHKKEKMMIRDDGVEEDVVTKRNYAGTLDVCAQFCDQYSSKLCVGVDYDEGYCKAYSVILGPFSAAGEIALIRQS